MDQRSDNLIDVIPPPEVVRERLTHVLRDAELLRDLLKVAERKERQRAGRSAAGKEVKRAS